MSDIANPGAHPVEGSPEESAEAVINSIDKSNAGSQGAEEVEDASDEELEDILDDEDASEEAVVEAKKELSKRIQMKINGKDEDFDLSDDSHIERLREMAQKGEGADQKFQEASKMRKQMEQFAKLMQDDPIAALKRLGHDPDSIAEMHMQKRLEEMQKSPEQLEREALQKELEGMKKDKERIENERLEMEKKAAQESYSRKLDTEITEALAKSEMPKSPYVVKRLAEYMMMGLKKDPNFDVKDAVPLVERQIKREIQEMFEAMPEDIVEKLLGQNVTTKLRKRRLSQMKKAPATAAEIKQTGKAEINKSKQEEVKKPVSAKDLFKSFGDY